MSWPLWFGVLLAAAALLTALGEITARQGWISLFAARKGVHITVAICCALAVEILPASTWFTGAVGLIVLFLWYSVRKQWFSIDQVDGRRSWGIFYFGLSYFFLLLLFGQQSPFTVMLGMAVMGLADSVAALIGKMLPNPSLTLGRETKSWAGSAVFFIITGFLLFSLTRDRPGMDGSDYSALSMVALVFWLTVVENSAGKGTDNLSVPLLFGWVYATMMEGGESSLQERFLWVFIPAGLFALLSARIKFLTRDGAISAASLGILLYTYGGWNYVVPILIFFLTGSLLSRLLNPTANGVEKSGARDSWQVLANGGVPALGLFWGYYTGQQSLGFILFAAALASVTADTWSTEIGMRFGGTPRHILNGKKMAKGLSGGVTLAGFLGALFGASLIATVVYWLNPDIPVLWIIALGFAGSILDSIAGVFQAKYQAKDSELWSEKRQENGIQISGVSWWTNDLVNAFSALIILLFSALLFGGAG
ncbi:DUF92 domain-containing protein [Cryomorphaceae bacterium]|nr:DUF92 domain-containing protein [Cryomorphaceae bacterium]